MIIGLEHLMQQLPPRPGTMILCTIPRSLGIITALNMVRGRIVASTSAGIPFIAPPMAAPVPSPKSAA